MGSEKLGTCDVCGHDGFGEYETGAPRRKVTLCEFCAKTTISQAVTYQGYDEVGLVKSFIARSMAELYWALKGQFNE